MQINVHINELGRGVCSQRSATVIAILPLPQEQSSRLFERHTAQYVCLALCVCLSVCLSVSLYVSFAVYWLVMLQLIRDPYCQTPCLWLWSV